MKVEPSAVRFPSVLHEPARGLTMMPRHPKAFTPVLFSGDVPAMATPGCSTEARSAERMEPMITRDVIPAIFCCTRHVFNFGDALDVVFGPDCCLAVTSVYVG
jgi:hypothetical protein